MKRIRDLKFDFIEDQPGPMSSKNCKIKIDENDDIHIVWRKNTGINENADIFYAKWDGQNWLQADGESFGTGGLGKYAIANVSGSVGHSAAFSFDIDSKGYPHVVWRESYDLYFSDIYYARWDEQDWATEKSNVSRSYSESGYPSIALDSNDLPHITWSESNFLDVAVYGTTNELKSDIFYIKWDGQNWLTAGGEKYAPYIAVEDNTARITYSHLQSIFPKIHIDKNDNPHIVWKEYLDGNTENTEICYIKWDGWNWVSADGKIADTKNIDLVSPINISKSPSWSQRYDTVFDEDGHMHIAWQDKSIGETFQQVFYLMWNGDDWVCADGSVYDPKNLTKNNSVIVFGGKSYEPRLCVDSIGNLHISFEAADYEIFYMQHDGGSWSTVGGELEDSESAPAYDSITEAVAEDPANISKTNVNSFSCDMLLDADDKPYIIWADGYKKNDKEERFYAFARWDGENWIPLK